MKDNKTKGPDNRIKNGGARLNAGAKPLYDCETKQIAVQVPVTTTKEQIKECRSLVKIYINLKQRL